MTSTYPLIPFMTDPIHYSVAATIERRQNILALTYVLIDPQNEVVWSPASLSDAVVRQDFLWESTCFEAFIGSATQTGYVELNLSPARAWNLYRFTDYRTPNSMPPPTVSEPALHQFDIQGHTIYVEIDLQLLGLAAQVLQIGLTSVIKTTQGLAYLALTHPQAQADFHDARGWTLRLLPDARFPEAIS